MPSHKKQAKEKPIPSPAPDSKTDLFNFPYYEESHPLWVVDDPNEDHKMTPDEHRRWSALTESLAAKKAPKRRTEAEEREATYAACKFDISSDGKDAVLRFGKWKHSRLSDLVKSDPSYVNWIIREPGFKVQLKDVARYLRDENASKVKAFEEESPEAKK